MISSLSITDSSFSQKMFELGKVVSADLIKNVKSVLKFIDFS
jgi:hypothetical protein